MKKVICNKNFIEIIILIVMFLLIITIQNLNYRITKMRCDGELHIEYFFGIPMKTICKEVGE